MYLGYTNWSEYAANAAKQRGAYAAVANRSLYPYSGAPRGTAVPVSPQAAAFRYTSYYKAPTVAPQCTCTSLHGVQLSEGLGQGDPYSTAAIVAAKVAQTLLTSKPSNFGEWIFFDNRAHYSHTEGDKPNAATIGMAAQVQNAMQQYVASAEAQGIQFSLPSDFAVEIGQRDPTSVFMPPHNATPTATLTGPGDPQGAVMALMKFLDQYRKSIGPAPASAVTAPPPSASVVPYSAPSPAAQPIYQPIYQPLSPQPISITNQPAQTDMTGQLNQYMPYILGGAALLAVMLIATHPSAAPVASGRK